MNQINETFKQQSIEGSQAVAGLIVYAIRLPSDDGWKFVVAKSSLKAKKIARELGYDGAVRAATHSELTTIAARALMGV